MAQIIKRPFKVFNGTDWDKHHFETSEDMICDAIQNSDPFSGYRVLAVGADGKKIIIQWGKVTTVPLNTQITVKFRIEFSNSCFGVFPVAYSSNQATTNVDYLDSTQFKLRQFNSSGAKSVYWFAIGC